MIHWLQNLLEKHLKWVFILLLGVIIVSFVFSIGAVRGLGDPATKIKENTFYGFDLNQPEIVSHLKKGALFSQILGTAPLLLNQNEQTLILARATLLYLANSLQLPNPTAPILTHYIKTEIPLFQKEDKSFNADTYDQFLKWMNESPEFGEKQAAQFMSEEYKIHLLKPYLGSSIVLPYEAIYQKILSDTQWNVIIASIEKKHLQSNETPTESDVRAYYENHSLAYQAPIQRQISYVVFETTSFNKAVKNPNEDELKTFFDTHKQLFSTKNESGERTTLDFDAVEKNKIQEAYTRDAATKMAYEAAENFLLALYDQEIGYNTEAFHALLAKYGLTLSTSPYFSHNNTPTNTPFTHLQLNEVFNLDDTHYYSDALTVKNGSALYFLDNEQPARTLTFDECKETVTKDYIATVENERFNQQGESLYAQLKSSTAADFQSIAESLKLTVQNYGSFDLKNPPQGVPQALLMALPQTPIGSVTPMTTIDDKGYFLLIKEKTIPTASYIDDPEIKKQIQQIEQMTQLFTQAQFLESMIENNPDHTH